MPRSNREVQPTQACFRAHHDVTELPQQTPVAGAPPHRESAAALTSAAVFDGQFRGSSSLTRDRTLLHPSARVPEQWAEFATQTGRYDEKNELRADLVHAAGS